MKVKEKLILIFSVAMFFGSLWYLGFYDQITKKNNQVGKKVGFISDKTNSLKRKPSQSLIWEDISIQENLYSGDKVFTPKDSTAVLNVGQKTSITMSPQTLLNFEDIDDGHFRIALEEGVVAATVNRNDKISSIGIGKEVLELTSIDSSFIVDSTSQNKAITILGGSASLKMGDQLLNLAQNEILVFNSELKSYKREKLNFKPIYPIEGSLLDSVKVKTINFSWKTLNPQQSKKIIEVSKDHKFSQILASGETDQDFYELTLPENLIGKIFWRLKYKDTSETYFPVYFFEVINLLPLKILSPKANENIFLSPYIPNISVDFQWEERPGTNFSLEYGGFEEGAEKLIKSIDLIEAKYLSEPLAEGKYWWRIQQKVKGGFKLWQEKEYFEISDSKTALPPFYLAPENKSTINIQEGAIPFKWNGTPKINYTFTLATDSNFEKIVESHSVANGKYDWKMTATGKLFWKISHESLTTPPKVWSFDVKVNPPILSYPPDDFQTTLLSLGDKIQFKWASSYPESVIADFKTYDFVINQGIKEIYRTTVKENEAVWAPKESGDYEWKIEVPGAQSITQRLRIRFSPSPQKPILKKEIRSRIKKRSISSKPFDFTAYELIAQNGDSPLKTKKKIYTYAEFSWPEIKEARQYILEVYRDSAGKELELSRQLKKNSFEWNNAVVGIHYFRIAYLDKYDRKSPFSDLSKLIIEELKETRTGVKLLYPENKFTSLADKQGFEWKAVENATSYKLLIYQHNSKSTYYEGEAHCPYIIVPISQGLYRWKIIAYDGKNEIEKSEERTLKIITLRRNGQELVGSKNPYIDSFYEFDLLSGKVNSDLTVKDNGKDMQSSYGINTFPRSVRARGGIDLSFDHYVTGFASYQNGLNSQLSYTHVDIGGYFNWFAFADEELVIYFGPGGKYTSLNFDLEDSVKDTGANFNYIAALFQATMINKVKFIDGLDQLIQVEGGGSYTTVDSLQLNFSYTLRKSRFSLFQTWRDLYNKSFLTLGFEYSTNDIKYHENDFSIREWRIPLGFGMYHDWF